MTDNDSSNNSTTCKIQSTLPNSAIKSPALRNHITCMVHIIQLALGAFIRSLGITGSTRSCEAPECDQQCGENQCLDNGNGQTLRKDGNGRIHTGLARRPGLAKIIEKVHISAYCEIPETDL